MPSERIDLSLDVSLPGRGAGVGSLRVADRDFVETSNLQRQMLFDESDAAESLPKAVAAERHLHRINSDVQVEGRVSDVTPANIEPLIVGASVVLEDFEQLDAERQLLQVQLKEEVTSGRISYAQYQRALSPFTMSTAILSGGATAARFYRVCGELAHKKNQLVKLGDERGNSALVQSLRSELSALSPRVRA